MIFFKKRKRFECDGVCGRSMRRELSMYVLGLASVSALVFAYSLITYFDRGLSDATKSSIIMETRAFEAEYLNNPNTPLPRTSMMNFYIDDWSKASALYKKIIPFDELEINDYVKAEWKPFGDDDLRDAHFLVAYWHKLPDGRDLYVTYDYLVYLLTDEEVDRFNQTFRRVIFLGGGYFLLMILVVWFYNRRISRSTEQLALWAVGLTLDNVDQPRKDFRYTELNRVAEELQSAFERIFSLMNNERQFLRHASHELRTPIAVIRSNIELMDRIGIPAGHVRPTDRIRRASHGMQQLTETLLWLSRENQVAPNSYHLQINLIVDEIREDLAYLLQDKDVQVICSYENDIPELLLPETPLRIVVGNLIRNAFQYTFEGCVDINISGERIIIENHDRGIVEGDSDESFGLGLMLVAKICEKLEWPLEITPMNDGMRTELTLPVSKV